MNDLDLQRFLEPSALLDPQQVVMTLALALGLSLSVAVVYRLSVPGRVLSPAMQSSLVLLAMVAAMVMLVIGMQNLSDTWSSTSHLLMLGIVISAMAPLGD